MTYFKICVYDSMYPHDSVAIYTTIVVAHSAESVMRMVSDEIDFKKDKTWGSWFRSQESQWMWCIRSNSRSVLVTRFVMDSASSMKEAINA